MATEIEILGRVTTGQIMEAMRTVMTAYATMVQHELSNDKPSPPAPGSMKFVSDRQRKFVMANIREGKITVPYVRGRGNKLRGSETLNRSYRLDLEGDTVMLKSSASYANYVVGDQQAPIHQGRWTTAREAAERIQQRGDLQYIVTKAMENL
jgi:hypothetical protein